MTDSKEILTMNINRIFEKILPVIIVKKCIMNFLVMLHTITHYRIVWNGIVCISINVYDINLLGCRISGKKHLNYNLSL